MSISPIYLLIDTKIYNKKRYKVYKIQLNTLQNNKGENK